MDSSKLLNSFTFYASTTLSMFRYLISFSLKFTQIPIFFTLIDTLISTYYRFCDLSPFTVDLDDQTTVHFWISNHRRHHKPNLVIIHGYGGDARWQFYHQVGPLSDKFNLFVPDLVFFGKSYSGRSDRTDVFQASCVVQGLKRLGVDRFSVYSISYGGYVAYRVAQMCPAGVVEKVVIVSSGVGSTCDQRDEQIRRVGRDPRDLLVPRHPRDLRMLVRLTTYKDDPLRWLPDFVLREFIYAMYNTHRKEKLELVEHLLAKAPDSDLPTLNQETLLIWGDKDNVFPVNLAYQLQRVCCLSPYTINLDPETTMHFWTTKDRSPSKPNLVMIHGYGGDARSQFLYQVGGLSRKFNLYMPDLLFFGKSYSHNPDRTDVFQARCVVEGLKKLGVDMFSVYSISYGGFVAYRMAEMYPEEVERVVIVSAGVGCTEEQKSQQLRKIGRDPKRLLLPENPADLRVLLSLSMCRSNPLKWVPDFFLQCLIDGLSGNNKKQKLELVEHLLANKTDRDLPVLSQETLLIWGDHDNVFPIEFAHQLQRHLGAKSRLEIIKDTGHAANVESPEAAAAAGIADATDKAATTAMSDAGTPSASPSGGGAGVELSK
ncbi:hypothetical protein Tsubulata_028215 [Turnera subulata]|uniref:AB hydrolase-1 domain-containing protein n=1 Tax=Turnera subulata TaxID=218843 RepID=A0A9Q0FMC2_9ROSI|nr:hypothetical protein Tsubulata_028215 [Turnera subulata]